MAKRMTDTDKWKKPFIKSLPVEYKLFWLYLLDDCDHAGIWHVDFEVAEIRLGAKLSQKKAEGLFAEKVVLLDSGSKWFIPDFIKFQYGDLSEKNKMYKPVQAVINKYDLMGHLSPIYGGKDKEQVKDKVEVKGGVGEVQTFDVETDLLKNQIRFEAICMGTGKTSDFAKKELHKFHLYYQEKHFYPTSQNGAFAGFERWLINSETFKSSLNVKKEIIPNGSSRQKNNDAASDYLAESIEFVRKATAS